MERKQRLQSFAELKTLPLGEVNDNSLENNLKRLF